MNSYVANPLFFIVQTLGTLYITAVMLRLILPLVNADFSNPISQFVVRITAKPLHILRRVIPPFGKVDSAAIVLLVLLQALLIFALLAIQGVAASPVHLLVWTITGLIHTFLNLMFFAIIIIALMSWVNPDPYNPMMRVLTQITAPFMNPIRSIVPAMGGLDISPIFAILAIQVLKMLIPAPFMSFG